MTLRAMHPADLDFAAACTSAEGWRGETRTEFENFLADPHARGLVAEIDGERAGIAVAISYGVCGFIGELIVRPPYRGRGLGAALMAEAIRSLKANDVQSIFLDGVPEAVSLYERLGFRKVCRSLRFSGACATGKTPGVRAMTRADGSAITALDEEAFGAPRAFYLRRRLAQAPDLCWVQERDGTLAGFLMGRRGDGTVTAGPWIMADGVEPDPALLHAFAAQLPDRKLILCILETNQAACAIASSVGLAEQPDPPWRMVLGAPYPLGTAPGSCACGSAAKG